MQKKYAKMNLKNAETEPNAARNIWTKYNLRQTKKNHEIEKGNSYGCSGVPSSSSSSSS